MRNWTGQHLHVGDKVWRGARDGNTSSFKVGEIIKLDEKKRTARIKWLSPDDGYWAYNDSTCTIDSLTKFDTEQYEYYKTFCEARHAARVAGFRVDFFAVSAEPAKFINDYLAHKGLEPYYEGV